MYAAEMLFRKVGRSVQSVIRMLRILPPGESEFQSSVGLWTTLNLDFVSSSAITVRNGASVLWNRMIINSAPDADML